MDDLLDYLFRYAKSHGYKYSIESLSSDYTCGALPNYNAIIINERYQHENWLPFAIGHEIGHLVNKDTGVCYFNNFRINTDSEYNANLVSLKLIFSYYIKNNDCLGNPFNFIELYGIPKQMMYYTFKLFENQNDLVL